MFKLIAVTDQASCPRPLVEQIARLLACPTPPNAIILRAKAFPAAEYAALAAQVMAICAGSSCQVILHSHVEIAKQLECTALHLPLPQLRALPATARQNFAYLSTSVHSTEETKEAMALGATALIAGHIYTTTCKEGVPPRGLAFLSSICQHATVPVYAIGGIGFNYDQWEELQTAGAQGACIMSAYMRT